jgi:putative peptidoglycan lipid II flippase
MNREAKAGSGTTGRESGRDEAERGERAASSDSQPIEPDSETKIKETPERDDASVIAGETDIPVGTAAGESPGEQAAAQRERKSSAGTGKHAILVGAGILLSRLVGLVRQRVFAHYFGTSDAADAFNAAFRIPNFLQNVFGEGALSASFIPVYARLLAQEDRKEATRVASAVLSVLALVTAIIVLAGVLTTPYLLSLIAPGFTGEKRELTIRLIKIFFPGAGLLVLSAWCLGVLNSHRRFFLSYTAPVVWNIAIIVALVVFGRRVEPFPLAEIVAWGSVIGSGLQFAVQLPFVFQLVKGLRPILDIATANVRTVLRNFFPVFVSRGVVQISAFVDAWLASWLGTGAVAALAYTQSLYTLPVSLFGMSVSAAELPAMSSALGSQEEVTAQVRERLNSGLRQIAFFIVPSAVGFLALGDVMTGALYQTGKFQHDDVLYVWAILAGSSVGLLASTLGRLYSSTYYALHDTRTPLRYAALRVVLTIVLGYLCSIPLPRLLGIDQQWGAAGLTASAGVSGWIEFVLLRRTLNARIGRTGLPGSFVLKLWGAALTCAAVGWGVKLGLNARSGGFNSRHPIVGAAIILGLYGLLYFALTSLLGLPEARTVIGRFTRLARLRK